MQARQARAASCDWPPHSRLFVVGDGAGWSLDRDADHLRATAGRLGVPVAPAAWAPHVARQSVFLTSHFTAMQPGWLESDHRLATAWFHGLPGTEGYPDFDAVLARLRAQPERLSRIQVTHAAMGDVVVTAGVPAAHVHLIPIGIEIAAFPRVTSAARSQARARLGLPEDAFVVGSFQKDGDGWGEGLVPKLIKGPDVLVETLARLSSEVPNVWGLLTGPARGYVRRELAVRDVPYVHRSLTHERELAGAYHALDAYLVPARQEGGPKGVLEALATGIPLVSTRVGQATEIVRDGEDGQLAPVGDVDALVAALARVASDEAFANRLAESGRKTAERYDHRELDPLWQRFFEGVVE